MTNRIFNKINIKKTATVSISFTEKTYNEYKKKLFIGLQKYQTSAKTKSVYHLYENNLIKPSVFLDSPDDNFGFIYSSNNKLLSINFNADICADFAIDESASYLITTVNNLFEEIDKQKELISEYQVKNINKLKEKIDLYLNKFINIFDYMKIVDISYYLYNVFLSILVFKNYPTLKIKFLRILQQFFTKLFLKIYNKTTRAPIDEEQYKNFDIISTYLILNFYAGLTFREVLVIIKGAYGEGAVELLKKTNKTKLDSFIDIVDVMFETGIFKIQKSLFETYMRKYLSEVGYIKIKTSLVDTISTLISINHKNTLFNIISPFEKETQQLEELVLNMKSKIIIPQMHINFKG